MSLSDDEREALLSRITDEQAYALKYDWSFWARPDQLLPPGDDWRYWLALAGRGYGKTRLLSETVRIWARDNDYVNIIGATRGDARDIIIEGESGILRCCPRQERPEYKKHEAKLVWPNGSVSLIFTADEPDRLRGKQHSKLACDELAAWRYPEAWDQAKFGLRLGRAPQAVIATTPRPTRIVREILKDPLTVVVRGSTQDNAVNLPEAFIGQILSKYEGTRLGRQEIYAEILDDMPGALWTRSNLDANRVEWAAAPAMQRIVIGIDPAVSTEEHSDETGIVACGLGDNGRGYAMADVSGRYTPDEWATKAAELFEHMDADAFVVEVNQGGDMVANTLRSRFPRAPIREVRASRGKYTRAEPVAALYEQNRISHVGSHPTLEDQMVQFYAGSRPQERRLPRPR